MVFRFQYAEGRERQSDLRQHSPWTEEQDEFEGQPGCPGEEDGLFKFLDLCLQSTRDESY